MKIGVNLVNYSKSMLSYGRLINWKESFETNDKSLPYLAVNFADHADVHRSNNCYFFVSGIASDLAGRL